MHQANFAEITHDSKCNKLAIGLCVTFFIIALLLAQAHKIGSFGTEGDFFGAYAPQAENILAGEPYTYKHNAPGYMLMIAGLSKVVGDLFTSAKLLSAFASAMFVWLSYHLLAALFTPVMALASALLMAIVLLPASFLATMDMVGAMFMIVPVWLFLRTPTLSYRLMLSIGLLTAIAYLVRYNSVAVLLGIIFSIVLLSSADYSAKQRLQYSAVFLLSFLASISPWLIINTQINGSPFASTSHLQVAQHFYHPAGDLIPMYDDPAQLAKFGSMLDVVFHNPVRFFSTYINDIVFKNSKDLIINALGFPTVLFAGAGLLLLLCNLDRRQASYILILLLNVGLLGLVGFYLRYYYFVFPFLFLCSAYFIFHSDVDHRIRMTPLAATVPKLSALVTWGLIGLAALFLMKANYYRISSFLKQEPQYISKLAEKVQAVAKPGDGMYALKAHYGYFAKLKRFNLTPTNLTAMEELQRIRESGVGFIVYSDLEAKSLPWISILNDAMNPPSGFTPIYHHKPTNTIVYQISANK